jgi:hypothetical protein
MIIFNEDFTLRGTIIEWSKTYDKCQDNWQDNVGDCFFKKFEGNQIESNINEYLSQIDVIYKQMDDYLNQIKSI